MRTIGNPLPSTERRLGRLLTVEQAAEYMNTTVRFVRRLVAERRIAFVKLGRHVRLSTSDPDAFVAAGRVEPVNLGRRAA